MRWFRRFAPLLATAVALMLAAPGGSPVLADEGMWTFDKLPLPHLKDTYGFEPPPGWVEHLRLASVRFNSGGSGSFVSRDGLVMTNHHVGADALQKLSTADHDYYQTGFSARTRGEEIKAPDLELNVLVGIKDVTDQIAAAVPAGADLATANSARRGAMARIERESLDQTGLRSDVVTLYQGGRYALYTYKKYTDVRLVFAPEFAIAFFGGDPDNFEYPRYDLDICFFRAYENDKPAQPEHFLKWSLAGSKEGDLTFVAGHPGRTSRLNTVAHLEYLRDVGFPLTMATLTDRESFLLAYGKLGPEQYRQSKEDLFRVQNSLKARGGGLKGLKDPALMERKRRDEEALRQQVAADPAQQAAYGAAWDAIARSKVAAAALLKPTTMLERASAFDTHLFTIARTLVRLAAEQAKPDADRLREFRQAARASLELELYSEAPIYPDYEAARLARSLTFWQAQMPGDPILARVLAGRTPEAAAKALVEGSKLADVRVRRQLADGGLAAIEASTDPMIKLAMAVDADARAVRKRLEDEVEAVDTAQYALIARARFARLGETTYPDATSTLRLAFGTVRGIEQGAKVIPAYTTIGGAFEHAQSHGEQPPYQLPPSWLAARRDRKVRLDTPLNFISTADVVGGNSGSPVVNRNNEVVGLVFDGNIDSLVLDFGYDDRLARTVSVDSRGILAALQKIYGADALAAELTGKP